MPKNNFIKLEEMTEIQWKEVESLTRQVEATNVFPNGIRSAVAAFILWLTENTIGIELEKQIKPQNQKVPSEFH